MKPKVLIAIVPRIQDDFGYTPAGPALIKGSLVKHGFDCKVLDLNRELDTLYQDKKEELVPIENWFMNYNFYSYKVFKIIDTLVNQWCEEILAWNPTHVGISVFSYNSQRATIMLATMLKSKNPDVQIFIGGAGIATDFRFPEQCKNEKIIDAYIRGEGEIAVVEYLKGNLEYPGINGKAPKQIEDIENLNYPDYSDYELQNYTNKKGLVALPITGSRGCVRHCTFCDIASMWPKYKFRSGKSIAEEIKQQVDRYGVRAFRFTDSLVNGSMKAFREMTDELSKFRTALDDDKKFIWDSHFIVRSKEQMPPEDFKIMKESGAGTLLIGVESGSPTVREHMKKGYNDEDLEYSLEQIFKNKIKVRFLMIIGYPTETREDFNMTLEMFKKYQKYSSNLIEEVNLGLTLNLLPNTPLYNEAEKHGLETTKEHINDWVCKQNPTLDFEERLRRRIEAQYFRETLGYKVFESKNYTRALAIAWSQVKNLKSKKIQIDADKLKFDREQGGLIVPDPHRTY